MQEDRHYSNIEVLKDNKTLEYVDFAPVLDNGRSMFVFKSDEDLKKMSMDELNALDYSKISSASHLLTLREFHNDQAVSKFAHLHHFRFQRHPLYNLSNERLDILESVIHQRARQIIDMIQGKYLLSEMPEKEIRCGTGTAE